MILQHDEIEFNPSFLNSRQADNLFQQILIYTQWEQGKITIFGKEVLEPRLRCWYGEKGYTYSNSYLPPSPFPNYLIPIKKQIENITKATFNSVLMNYYRNGNDSMGWHQDNEPELGKNPVIASLSLGQDRFFHLKHNETKELVKLNLTHGSLLIMKGEIQHYWKHQIPKTKKIIEPRINLTFRKIW